MKHLLSLRGLRRFYLMAIALMSFIFADAQYTITVHQYDMAKQTHVMLL